MFLTKCESKADLLIGCRLLLHPEGGKNYATKIGPHYSQLIPKQIMEELLVLRKFKSVNEKHISHQGKPY